MGADFCQCFIFRGREDKTTGCHPACPDAGKEERGDEGSQPVMVCATRYWVRSSAVLRMKTRLGDDHRSTAALRAGLFRRDAGLVKSAALQRFWAGRFVVMARWSIARNRNQHPLL